MSADSESDDGVSGQIREIEVREGESIDEHIAARQELDSIVELIKSEYEADDVSADIKDTIRQTYRKDAQDTVRRYRDLDEDVTSDEYCEGVEQLTETLESILSEPHARKLVNDLSSWLTSEGMDPLSEQERDSFVENIKNDVPATTDYVDDLKENWSLLRDNVPDSKPVLHLIRNQILLTQGPSDIRSLSLDVRSAANELTYPIILENDAAFASDIESRMDTLVGEQLNLWVDSSDKFEEFESKISKEWSSVRDSVKDIENCVDNILELKNDISNNGINESRITGTIDRFAGTDESTTETPDSLRTRIESVQKALNKIRGMSRQELSLYQPDETEIPDRIRERIKIISEKHDEAKKALDEAIDAEDPSQIDEKEEAFNDAIDAAEDETDSLADQLKKQAETIKNLAEEFGATDQVKQARELLNEVPSMTGLVEYIGGFKQYEELRTETLKQAREDLGEEEDQVFKIILDQGGQMTIDSDRLEDLSIELGWEKEHTGIILMSLNQKGFIDLDARAF